MKFNISEQLGVEVKVLDAKIEGRLRKISKTVDVMRIDLDSGTDYLDYIARYAQDILDYCREVKELRARRDFAEELKFEYDYHNPAGKNEAINRDAVIKQLADHFGIEPDEETGEYDLTDSDWTSGCRDYVSGKWFSLAEVVKALTEQKGE